MNKNKIIVLLIALVAVFAYNKMQNKQPLQSQNQQKIETVQKQNNAGGENADTAQQQTGLGKQSAEAVLKQAFENEQSDIQLRARARYGKHSRMTTKARAINALSWSSPAVRRFWWHTISTLPIRLRVWKKGDKVAFYGEYEWSEQGGVIHWTHHDPSARHTDGWLKHDGRLYQ